MNNLENKIREQILDAYKDAKQDTTRPAVKVETVLAVAPFFLEGRNYGKSRDSDIEVVARVLGINPRTLRHEIVRITEIKTAREDLSPIHEVGYRCGCEIKYAPAYPSKPMPEKCEIHGAGISYVLRDAVKEYMEHIEP